MGEIMTPAPITLLTTAICAVIFLVFSIRVVRGRIKYGVGVGDGGQPELVFRIRTHANFAEYVPMALILMALLEVSGADTRGLMAIGGLLIAVRIAHAFGLPQPRRKGPHPLRSVGAAGTFLLLLIEAVWAILIVAA